MQGSIRLGIGFMVVFGAVGGMDAGNDLLLCVTLAVTGLLCMFSGVKAMNRYE